MMWSDVISNILCSAINLEAGGSWWGLLFLRDWLGIGQLVVSNYCVFRHLFFLSLLCCVVINTPPPHFLKKKIIELSSYQPMSFCTVTLLILFPISLHELAPVWCLAAYHG